VPPCYDCGHETNELQELKDGEHEYHKFKVFNQTIILCDFCDADFGSYYPDYFGLLGEFPQDYLLELIEKIKEPIIEKDMYCSKCQHCLKFIKFREASIEFNKQSI
jgi:hypothetical protein